MKIGLVTLSFGIGKFLPFQDFANRLITLSPLGIQEVSLVVCGVAAGLTMSLHALKWPMAVKFVQK